MIGQAIQKKKFEPHLGLIVYKSANTFGDYYIQIHPIEKIDGDYTWKEGRPFKKESLQELAVFLRNENISTLELKGIMPENIIYYQPSITGNKFIWYIPPAERFINFSSELKIKSGPFMLPGLLFAVNDKSLYVFAITESKRPSAKTILHNGPFWNVYVNGSVCMGTTSESTRKISLHEEIDRWERRFFGSRFTSAHGDDDDKLAKGFTLKKLYRGLRGKKQFPVEALAKSPYKTLGGFMKRFIKKAKNDED